MPAIVIHVEGEISGPWVTAFQSAFPPWIVLPSNELDSTTEGYVHVAVVWAPPPGLLGRFRKLKHVISLGTGLDHLERDTSRPVDVPVLARRDPASMRTMAEFVLMQVLIHHRRVWISVLGRPAKRWDQVTCGPLAGLRIGILGFGPMAQASAELLLGFGCSVTAWSRQPKGLSGN